MGVALCLAAFASAADKDVEDLLSHMRDAYKAIKAATYQTEAKVFNEENEKSVTMTSDFAYKSPNMIRVIMRGGGLGDDTLTAVTDGKKITITAPKVSIPEQDYTAENFERVLAANLESMCFYDWEKQLSTEKDHNMEHSTFNIVKDEDWDDKKWTVLEESAKEQNVFCRYFIDPKTFLIWRTDVKKLDDKSKPIIDAKLTKLDTDATLDDNMFKGGI